VIGCGGVREQVELALTPKEQLGIQQSARVLRDIINQVEARVGKVRTEGSMAHTPRGNAVPKPNGRTIPRSAWVANRK
jgi:hypothetical protein